MVRVLCNQCKTEKPLTTAFLPEGFVLPNDIETHYEGKGCQSCHFTGYHGRKALYEILPVGKELHPSIKNNLLEIDAYIEENSIATLRTNAIDLIRKGITSVEEVYPMLIE